MNNLSFLDTIEKVYMVASQKIDKQLEEDVQEIIKKLCDYFIKIIDLKNDKPEKYRNLLVRSRYTSKKNPQNIPFLINEAYEPSLEGIQIYCNIFFKIWKKSYDNDLENTAYYMVSKIEDILQNMLSRGKDYMTVSNYFIRLIQNINLEISKSPNRFSSSIARASYVWFFDIVFDDDFKLQLINDLQIALFISVRISIANRNKRIFNSFIEHIINGLFYPVYGMLPDIDYQTKFSQRKISIEYDKVKNKLRTESDKAITLQDYQKVEIAFENFESVIYKFSNVETSVAQNILLEYKLYIEKKFKYNIVQQTIIWLGSYCLYSKQYDYIYDLLYYNQPKDSTVLWVNQDINPMNIGDILILFYRRHELDNNITFLWEGHHEFLTYYNTFIAILLMNAINQNQRKGEISRNDFNPEYKHLSISTQELEGNVHSINNLQSIVQSIKNDSSVLSGCGLSEQLAENAIKLLTNIRLNIERQIQEIKISAEISPIIAQKFVDSVYELYDNNASLRNIINFYNPISDKISKYPGKKYQTFGINEIMTKALFIEEDKGTYIGFQDGVARKFIFNENISLMRIFIESSINKMKTDDTILIQELDKLKPFTDKVLIFLNVYPSYEIFNSKSDFIPAERVKESDRPLLNEFIGRYKEANIFTYYNETKGKHLLVLKKQPKAGIGRLKYYVPTKDKDFNTTENFYWKMLELKNEHRIMENILDQQPFWLLQQASDKESQRKYLQEQVNLIILYKMNLFLPRGFQGWIFQL